MAEHVLNVVNVLGVTKTKRCEVIEGDGASPIVVVKNVSRAEC